MVSILFLSEFGNPSQHYSMLWVTLLSIVGFINVYYAVGRARIPWKPSSAYQKRLADFAVIYSLGCWYRSLNPVVEAERVCFFGFGSVPVTTRTAATFAEISFASMLGAVLYQLTLDAESLTSPRFGTSCVKIMAGVIVAGLTLAQGFCWYAVLTLWQLSHAIEETIWTLCIVCLLPCAWYLRSLTEGHTDDSSQGRLWLKGVLVLGPCYIAFMTLVDVPMYLLRHARDQVNNASYLSLSDGWRSACNCTVLRTDQFWTPEMPWMTGYFFVAVWLCLWMMRAPRLLPKATQQRRSRRGRIRTNLG